MKNTKLLILLLLLCVYTACSLKSGPAPDSGFLQDPEKMAEHRERFPFNRSWCEPESCDWRHYRHVVVAPVDTTHTVRMSWWDKVNLEKHEALKKERHQLAAYTQHAFIEAYKNDPLKMHRVVSIPDRDTMILELAIVEVVPTKVFLHAAGDILGFVVPGGGVVGTGGSGAVAIEGRLRDAKSGTVIFTFADKEKDRAALVSLADLTWHSHAKEIVEDWADELVKLSDTPPDMKVVDSSPFTLRVL